MHHLEMISTFSFLKSFNWHIESNINQVLIFSHAKVYTNTETFYKKKICITLSIKLQNISRAYIITTI